MANKKRDADGHLPRTIAPRLASGDSRDSYGAALPANIKRGLRLIAQRENQSVSWVMEQVITAYFGLKRPRYINETRYSQKLKARYTPLTERGPSTEVDQAKD